MLNPYIPQLVLLAGVATTQVQDLAVDFVEPHEALLGPLLKPTPCVGFSCIRTVREGREAPEAPACLRRKRHIRDDNKYLESSHRAPGSRLAIKATNISVSGHSYLPCSQ